MYFTASWCGPCKMVKPTINKLIKEDFDIEVIDKPEAKPKKKTSKKGKK